MEETKTEISLIFLAPTCKSEFQSVSVWCALYARGWVKLVRILRNQNTQIRQENLQPFPLEKHGAFHDFIFQDSNCGPHRNESLATYMQPVDINRMLWTEQGPDSNRGLMKTLVRQRPVYSNNPDALFNTLQEIWNSLPNSYFSKLSSSMSNRIESVMDSEGAAAKYWCRFVTKKFTYFK